MPAKGDPRVSGFAEKHRTPDPIYQVVILCALTTALIFERQAMCYIVRFVTRREGPSKPKKFRSRLLREATRQGLGARRPTSATRQLPGPAAAARRTCVQPHGPERHESERLIGRGCAALRVGGICCRGTSKFQWQASRHAEGGALARKRRPLCFAGCCGVGTIPRSSVPQKPVPVRPVLEPVCLVLPLPISRVDFIFPE